MIRRVYKSVAVIGRAHESVSVIRRALNSEAKPLVKYDVGSRSSGEGQNQTVAAIDDDSEAEEQAKVPDYYRTLLDIVQRRYSSASTYDVPKDSKAEEQPKVQDCRQVVIDEIQKGSCSPLTHYECRPADNCAHWLAIGTLLIIFVLRFCEVLLDSSILCVLRGKYCHLFYSICGYLTTEPQTNSGRIQ
ncbi:unnamed protein product [Malus baccata var. baccata]